MFKSFMQNMGRNDNALSAVHGKKIPARSINAHIVKWHSLTKLTLAWSNLRQIYVENLL